jgi:hypothetical protein
MKRILAGVLVVVVALIFAVNYLHSRKPTVKSLLVFPRFSRSACTRINFIDRFDTASLVRRGAVWNVLPLQQPAPNPTGHVRITEMEYPADTAQVAKALSMIETMQRQDLVSSNPARQAEFEVDTGSALFVQCLDSNGASLGGAYIGKTGEIYDSYYVRPLGTTNVYSVPGGVRFALSAKRGRWLDRSILTFDPAAVTALKIASADSGTIELANVGSAPGDSGKKGRWMITSPIHGPAAADKVAFVLNAMAKFKTVSWEGNMTLTDSAMGLARPSLELTATLSNGAVKTLIIGGDKVAMKWIRNPDMPKITFTAYEYTMRMFDPGLAGLKAPDSAHPR